MKLKIIGVDDPILRQISKPVKNLDKKITKIISDMWETLDAQIDPEGVGLAACQVGKPLQIFIMKHEDLTRTVINPKLLTLVKPKVKITEKTIREREKMPLEGCLSLPNYYGPLLRAKSIKIEYETPETDKLVKKVEEFTGFAAHIVEHELDHLKGKLFIDHIIQDKSPLYKYSHGKWEEVELI